MPPKKKNIPAALKRQVWLKRFTTVEGKCPSCNRVIYNDNFEAGHVIAEANQSG